MAAVPAPELSPAPAVALISPEIRLAYVLQHFRLAYDEVPPVAISYAAAPGSVMIADGAGSFFIGTAHQPPAPGWREWQSQRIPFFFDASPERPLLELTPGAARINADVIAGAFYLLSGWQEYFSPARDRHGRFPYAASVQQQYGFVTLPVVNYYFDVLKTAIEHVAGQALPPRRWGPAPFAAFITHDIDNIHGGWGTAARYLLRQGRPADFLKLLLRKATGQPAPWNNLEAVQAATARFGAPSTFFILGSDQPAANGTRNADYSATTPTFLQRLTQLAGAEIASHGSYGTATDSPALQHEISQLPTPQPAGNRFHYLGWEPTLTPQVLAQAGVSYDSTLGFAEHFGFRNSYCLPFFPFDFQRGQAYDFLEIPLNVMDATLHHPNYLQLAAAEVLPALRPMLLEIQKFGGVATVLWHNENFDPANEVNGPRQFTELMTFLQQQGARFVTGREIVQQLCSPPGS
jgi:peptidoglycan/xylan/chitin deacetylase (PgdA/CDA1 family)